MIPENEQIAQAIDEQLNSAPHGRDRENMIRLIIEALDAKDKKLSDEVSGMYEYTDELKAQLSHLKKLCEEQKAKLNQYENESAEDNLCKKHPKTMLVYGCNACFEEQKGEIAEIRQELNNKNYAIAQWKQEEILWKEQEADLLSQLATQTERVRQLEVALKEMKFAYDNKDVDFPHDFEEQAIKLYHQALQDTLGDGGRDEASI